MPFVPAILAASYVLEEVHTRTVILSSETPFSEWQAVMLLGIAATAHVNFGSVDSNEVGAPVAINARVAKTALWSSGNSLPRHHLFPLAAKLTKAA